MRNYLIILASVLSIVSCSSLTEKEILLNRNYQELTKDNLKTELAVLNLRVNPSDFKFIHKNFKEEIGIPAYLSIRRQGEIVFPDYLVDLKIKGSVSAELPLKSLGITFDKTVDNSSNSILSVNGLLDQHDLTQLKTIRLRNSGNDFEHTMIKQCAYMELVKSLKLNLDFNYIEPSVVFVNDQFHGIMNINSEVNANGLSRLYGFKKEGITLAKVSNPDQIALKNGQPEDLELFLSKINDMDINYFLDHLDIDNTLDYIVFQSFMANQDWPFNNVRLYKTTGSKWRFALFDLDKLNFWYLNKKPRGFIESTTENRMTDLFLLLLDNKEFKQRYDSKIVEWIKSPILKPENFASIIDRKARLIEDVMPFQVQKYGAPNTLTQWYMNLEELKSNYSKRHRYLTRTIIED